MQKGRLSLYTAVFLVIAAFITIMMLLPSYISGLSGKIIPSGSFGLFLFNSFSYAALYIPVYFIICAVLVVRDRFKVYYSILLLLSIIPFLTLALFFHVLSGDDVSLSAVILSLFGKKEGAFLVVLVFLAEMLSLYIVYLKRESFPGHTGTYRQSPLQLPEPAGLNTESSRGQKKKDEGEKEEPPSFFTAEIPDIPEFKKMSSFEDEDFQILEVDDTFEREAPDTSVLERISGDEDEVSPVADDDTAAEEEYTEEKTDQDHRIPLVEESSSPPAPPFRLEIQKVSPEEQKRTPYKVPANEILNDYSNFHYWIIDDETRKAADVLKKTLEEFKIKAEVTGIKKGPVITMFEILPAPGVKLSKIVNLADNIALRLAASRVRIVAPIPGKHAVGIEVPNKKRAIVSFKEMLADDIFDQPGVEIPVVLGKDITGESQIVDLVQTPHLLIAGATGSGKSVCVNSIICSILYKRKPEDVRIILIDPKIVELKLYNDIPHLLTPVITEPKRAFQALQYCIFEMERRYSLLDTLGVRDIRMYNKKIRKGKYAAEKLPYIVVIVDEFADLIATSGKELESTLARLAAMARAVGIHLVLATQRPSIDVITGLIKANIPSRIAFMVANKIDSRIILDAVGADKLLGKGDMLFASAWEPSLVRIQGAYVSDEEVERLTDYVKTLGEPDYIDEEIFFDTEEQEKDTGGSSVNDPLMDKSIEIVTAAGKASASYLQRRLKIGYNRAARIVEEMEERGIVGPQNGSKPREILHIPEKYRGNS